MITKNKVLYFHLRNIDNVVFYVGIGNEERAYSFSKSTRSKEWNNYVLKHGKPKVKIIEKNLTIDAASKLEKKYIKLIGRKDLKKGTLLNLTNGGECHSILNGDKKGVSVLCLKNGEIYKSIREYCKEKNIPHSTISSFLRGTYFEKDYNVRIIKNNIVQWNTCFDKKDSENLLDISETDLIECNDYIDVKKLFKNIDEKYIMAILIKNIHNKTFKEFKADFGFDIATVYYKGLNNINKKSNREPYSSKSYEIEKIYNKFKLIKEYSSLLNHLIS